MFLRTSNRIFLLEMSWDNFHSFSYSFTTLHLEKVTS
jgi:hypothetical protein